MSNLSKYLKNASWYVIGSTIQGLTPFVLTPFLTRTLPQEQFSEFVLFIAIGTILSFLFALGLPAALTRELILEKNNLENNLTSASLTKRYLLIAGIGLLILSLIINSFSKIYILALALSLALAVIQIDMAIFRAQEKANKFVLFAIFSTALPTIFMTIGIYFNYLNNNFIFFYALFVVIFAISSNLRSFKPELKSDAFSELFKLGWATIPHGLGMSLMQYGDRVVIASAIGLTAAGKIQVAALLGTAPLLLLSTLNHAWIPSVLEKFKLSKSDGINFLNKSTKALALFIFNLALLIIFINPWLLNLFAPENYELNQLSPVVILMSMAASIYIFYLRNTHVLTYLGRFQSLAWITPTSIFLQILTIFALTPVFGLLSAAFALLIVVSSQASLTQFVVHRLAPELKLTFLPLIYFAILSVTATLILI